MGSYQRAAPPEGRNLKFYRTTPKGAAGLRQCEQLRSPYLADVLELRNRGIGESGLRQFMPQASLEASVARLLELGLIECAEGPAPRAVR